MSSMPAWSIGEMPWSFSFLASPPFSSQSFIICWFLPETAKWYGVLPVESGKFGLAPDFNNILAQVKLFAKIAKCKGVALSL